MKNAFLASLLVLITVPAAFAAPKDAPSATTDSNVNNADYSDSYDADSDPIESVNRVTTKFNNAVDTVVYKPVARSYRYVVPQWGRNRVSNVLYNISEPMTVVNSVLQADPENSFTSLWRFLINSTVGVLGIFDVADTFGLKPRREDFGQTFAVWGWRRTDYLVIPFLGPSTLRDALGLGVEWVADPINIASSERESIARYVADAIDQRTRILPVTDDIERTSLDPYASYRSIYLQDRTANIKNTKLTPAF